MNQLKLKTNGGKVLTISIEGFGPSGNCPFANGAIIRPETFSKFVMFYLTSTKLFRRDERRNLVEDIKKLEEVPAENSHLTQYQKEGGKCRKK